MRKLAFPVQFGLVPLEVEQKHITKEVLQLISLYFSASFALFSHHVQGLVQNKKKRESLHTSYILHFFFASTSHS